MDIKSMTFLYIKLFNLIFGDISVHVNISLFLEPELSR